MARPCLTCIHPHRDAIDRALVSSEALSALSRQYELSMGALRRHQQKHVGAVGRGLAKRVPGVRGRGASSGFVEVAVAPPTSLGSEVAVELRSGRTKTRLRLRGHLDAEGLRILVAAVVGVGGEAP